MSGPGSPPTIEWVHDETRGATCPVCGAAGEMRVALRSSALGAPDTRLELVDCEGCGLRFFPGVVPRSFAELDSDAALELGLGLAGSIEALARIDTRPIRSMVEIGCGAGFTLDFARHAFGWRTLGVDDSAVALAARRELGIELFEGLIGEESSLLDGEWDLVYACEVLEHVTDPPAFVTALRGLLTAGGVLLVRTPDGATVGPASNVPAMLASLSPGFHTCLHTETSLDRLLRRAGFDHVEIVRRGATLHAAASGRDPGWQPDGRLADDVVDAYLSERAAQFEVGSPVRTALLLHQVNLLVNREEWVLAKPVLRGLGAQFRARHGLDFDDPGALFRSPGPAGPLPHLPGLVLTAAAMTLYAWGKLLAAGADPLLALPFLDAAERSARLADERHGVDGTFDPTAGRTRWLALLTGAAIGASGEPERIDALLELFCDRGSAAREEQVLEAFATLVAAGGVSDELAGRLADEVAAILAARMDAGRVLAEAEAEIAYGLGMLLLHGRHDNAGAAHWFAASSRGFTGSPQRWSARLNEGFARLHAGDRGRATFVLLEIVAAEGSPGGPAAPDVDHARRLLAGRST